LKNVNRSEGSADQLIGDKVDEEQLRRYSALMAQFSKENQAEANEQTPALLNSESAVA
jgi:hypothetical protein